MTSPYRKSVNPGVLAATQAVLLTTTTMSNRNHLSTTTIPLVKTSTILLSILNCFQTNNKRPYFRAATRMPSRDLYSKRRLEWVAEAPSICCLTPALALVLALNINPIDRATLSKVCLLKKMRSAVWIRWRTQSSKSIKMSLTFQISLKSIMSLTFNRSKRWAT